MDVSDAFRAAPADEARILLDAQAGDAGAFERIVRMHQAMVYGIAVHFTRDRELAEDVAQEVFLSLHRRLREVVSPAHLTAWLRRVASHRCIDSLRKRGVRAETSIDAVAERAAAVDTRDVLLEDRIRSLVAALPAPARLVVILRYQEDLDPTEIARALDMPLNTVKSHLRRAVIAIRAALPEGAFHDA